MSAKPLKIAKIRTEADILAEFGIKPCLVMLERATKISQSSGGYIDGKQPFKKPEIEIKSKVGRNQKQKSKALMRTNKSKPIPCKSVDIGEVIVCKMRGFVEWPAFVTGFEKNLVCIQFFGDNTTHKAAVKNFYKFNDSIEILLSHLRTKKHPLLLKAVKEVEVVLALPSNESIVRKI